MLARIFEVKVRDDKEDDSIVFSYVLKSIVEVM